MGEGSGYRSWHATLPPSGGEWREQAEFDALSDRAFAEQLKPLRHRGPLRAGEIAVIGMVRNEAQRLPLFFEHYRKLGVARFLMIDNDSQDATPEMLMAEPLADVFHTTASFLDACNGVYWQNGLARACCKGHWTLVADADELFVYDGMDDHGLPDLTRWLERHALDRVFAVMVDLYPPDVIGETGLSIRENYERNGWFDAAGYGLRRHLGSWLATGGPRQRLFGRKLLSRGEWTSKYPLFRMREGMSICNAHLLWPGDEEPARPLAALIHLKFTDDFAERAELNLREGRHFDKSRKYRTIVETLTREPRQVAAFARSAGYAGPQSLIAHDLLLPIDWTAGGGDPLPCRRTLGGIDYRIWTGMGRPASMPQSERAEFEDFARRAFRSHLTVVRSRGHLGPGEIGLICVLRNEAARLPLFFDHYKRLGVDRFFMIDNNSEDGSREILLAEPLADVFHAHALFSEGQGGLYWAHAVARRYGEGNWLIRPDADELFVYDRMEEHDLADLAAWLDRQGMDRVYAPLIDLYPSAAIGGSSQTIAELIEKDSWFDNDGYSLERWPQGWRLTGGPRFRLFHQDDSHRNLMWKYPFFRMGEDTLIYNHHWLWPHDNVTRGALGAMVHLKLMHDFIDRSRRYASEAQHFAGSNAYRVISEKVKDMPEVVAFHEGSKRYRGPRSLVRHGMLMPIGWEEEVRAFDSLDAP
ncbi:MAG: glycosyltransferase family 2 protein [Parvibaculaceae bacterium]